MRKVRVDTQNAVNFCVNLSQFALSKFQLTLASNLLNASFNFALLVKSCVLVKWSLYAVKLDLLASTRLSIGLMTAQWFWGALNMSKLNSVAVKLENSHASQVPKHAHQWHTCRLSPQLGGFERPSCAIVLTMDSMN